MRLDAQWFDAVSQGDTSKVAQLLEGDPKLLFLGGSYRRTALHIAAINGRDQIVAQLLVHAQSAELVNACDALFRTPLHLAAKYGCEKVVGQLLAANANIALVDVAGLTPLHHAALEGHGAALGVLLASKPEMLSVSDDEDRTVLHTAARKGHTHIVAQLLALNQPQLIHAADGMSRTALHHAAARGFDKVVDLLLAASPETINAVSGRGRNALHEATGNKQEAIVHILLEFSGSENSGMVSAIDSDGYTVLHIAIEQQCSLPLIARLLVVFPQALQVVSQRAETPFGIALRTNNEEVVELLQWRLTLDEVVQAAAVSRRLEDFRPAVEGQCEGLLQALNKDVLGTVFEYLGFLNRKRGVVK